MGVSRQKGRPFSAGWRTIRPRASSPIAPSPRQAWRSLRLPGGFLLSFKWIAFSRRRPGDAKLRRFFARLGFYPLSGDVMEKDIRQQLPPIPQAYRP